MVTRRLAHFSPGTLILLSLFSVIGIGTALLALPWARLEPISYIDLFFTATSVTCVTGLFTVSLAQFTFFGKCVILLLMQIGGLGIITLTLFIMNQVMSMGFTSQLMAGQLMELESWRDLRRLITFIILTTCICECIGAVLIFYAMQPTHQGPHLLFNSIFHAVTSFCNAGIDIWGEADLSPFANNYLFLVTSALLTLVGGIGFIALYEIAARIKSALTHQRYHFSLQTRLILIATLFELIIIASLIWMIEHQRAFAMFGYAGGLAHSICNALFWRSSGLSTIPLMGAHPATWLLILIIAFVGSSPGSTGSGVRIVTMAIYIALIRAAISGVTHVNILGRRIAKDQVFKAIAIINLSIAWIITMCICLLITQPHLDIFPLIFETISAYTNLGMSFNLTGQLDTIGKLCIALTMIIGRIGSLTLILALRKFTIGTKSDSTEFLYPEERVMLS